jgi:carboxyl-terminal processing protease
MSRGVRIAVTSLVAVILVLAAFAGGIAVARFVGVELPSTVPEVKVTSSASPDALMDQVRAIIANNALKPSSDTSMTKSAIDGMLKSLNDPYASYFDPKHYGYFKEDTSGQFGGIGVTLSVDKGVAKILKVLSGTPAEKVKLQAGDQIMKVDGWTKVGWTSEEVVSRVRGAVDTTVTLTIRRKGVADFAVAIRRANIEAPNIMTEMVGTDVGYMRLMQFNAQATDEVRKAIAELDKKGAKGYVLDLRENPGGLLEQGVGVASLFIKSGPIVRVDQRNQPEEVSSATGNLATTKPLVVLVDADSASAAEILAGALQDYKRATLVGTKTYGKGSVQTVLPLANGGAVKLTIAHYLTPGRRVIDRKGLTPDIVVKMDINKQAKHATDTQFQAAVTALRGMFR